MTKAVFLYLSIISTLLVSCSKNNDDDNVVPPAAPKLTRYVMAVPNTGGGVDTIFTSTFSWDASNRCTRIVQRYLSSGDEYYTDNYYNGSDTLIARRKFSESVDPTYISWEYFGYDASGKMNYDSTIDDALGNANVFIYKYTGNSGVYTLNLYYDVAGANADIRANYRHVYDGNGNIVSEIDSNYTYSSFSGTYDFNSVATSTTSFDNKYNPFYRIMPHRLVLLEHENFLSEDFVPFSGISQKNNITGEQRVVNPSTVGVSTYHNTITYQYNSNGYPTEMTFTDLENGSVVKGYYFY